MHEEGPGADQTHITFYNVEEGRQLVQTGRAEEAPQACQALGVGQQVPLTIARIRHGAELVEGERPAVQAGALLAEEDGGAQRYPDK